MSLFLSKNTVRQGALPLHLASREHALPSTPTLLAALGAGETPQGPGGAQVRSQGAGFRPQL